MLSTPSRGRVRRRAAVSAAAPPRRRALFTDSSGPMHRLNPFRWIACALAIAAFAPARHLAAQAATTDSIATIEVSQLGDVHLSVLNQDEVARAMARHVAHIGNVVSATVKVSFVIDENGRTRDVHADPTSGFKGVDRAAEGVVKEMRFTPPVQDGHPVRVRITMPISFTPTPG